MADQLSPTNGEEISKADAIKWITNYKAKNPGAVYAQFFGSDHLNKILNQPDCVGIRVYMATGDDGTSQLVLVGARADGTNIWPVDMASAPEDDGGVIVDKGIPCPPICSPDV